MLLDSTEVDWVAKRRIVYFLRIIGSGLTWIVPSLTVQNGFNLCVMHAWDFFLLNQFMYWGVSILVENITLPIRHYIV